MLYSHQDCLDSFKYLAKVSGEPELTLCQRYDAYSRQFGFNNYYHLKQLLPNMPTDQFGNFSLKLMRQFCARIKPTLKEDYFEFYSIKRWEIAFYSYWIGYDKDGKEIRVPRPLNGALSIDGVRKEFDLPVYVLENKRHVLSWMFNWLGVAYIPRSLAIDFFASKFNRKHFVVEDIDAEKIKQNNEDYSSNVAY